MLTKLACWVPVPSWSPRRLTSRIAAATMLAAALVSGAPSFSPATRRHSGQLRRPDGPPEPRRRQHLDGADAGRAPRRGRGLAARRPVPRPLPRRWRRGRGASSRWARASSSVPDGIVVTNNHVIEDADEITVNFPNGLSLKAEVSAATRRPTSPCSRSSSQRALALRHLRRQRRRPRRRLGARHRQPVRVRGLGLGRHHLGAQPRHQRRALRRLHPDRRRHQPRQFGRAAFQHGRRGHRREHRDHLADRRLDRHRLLPCRRTSPARWSSSSQQYGEHAPRLARRAHPDRSTTSWPRRSASRSRRARWSPR